MKGSERVRDSDCADEDKPENPRAGIAEVVRLHHAAIGNIRWTQCGHPPYRGDWPSSIRAGAEMIVRRQTALFLDYDGTLVDLAATPEAAHPPQGLVPLLQRLAVDLDGAVAILSGRTVADIDRMLAPLEATVGGVHGAEIRMADGALECLETPEELAGIRTLCKALGSEAPALRIEDKGQAIAVHFRAVPEAEERVGQALRAALAASRDLELIHGKMVCEVRRPGIHKGAVLQRLMHHPPFRDRTPLMIGDDRTDEDAFAMALQLGGSAIKVGEGDTVAPSRLANPDAVRHLLARAVETMKDDQ